MGGFIHMESKLTLVSFLSTRMRWCLATSFTNWSLMKWIVRKPLVMKALPWNSSTQVLCYCCRTGWYTFEYPSPIGVWLLVSH